MSFFKKGKKQSLRKVKNNTKSFVNDGRIKVITFPQLHKFSVENSRIFNQNVFTEELLKDFPKIKNLKLIIEKLMFHQHGVKSETPLHIRTKIFCGDDIPSLYQDLTIEQWDSLMNIPNNI